MGSTENYVIPASKAALNTINPIRMIFDNIKLNKNPEKDLVSLAVGVLKAREAVAQYMSKPEDPLSTEDIIMSFGSSGALDFCIRALANAGDNILIPKPGFSLYATLAATYEIQVKFYNLVPSRSWEIDLEDLARQIDSKTRAIVVCNPSNPCGSVYSRDHVLHVLELARQHNLPLIADEVYGGVVFPGVDYYTFSSLSKTVPVLSCNALTKKWLVPGWRMGWIEIHDRQGQFQHQVRGALIKLSQRLAGPCSFIQYAIPEILEASSQEMFDKTNRHCQQNALIAFDLISKAKGLKPIMPRGAMYMMIAIEVEKFPDIKDDKEFMCKLYEEQSVFCLPSQCFNIENFLRIVVTLPEEKLRLACQRICEFCEQHYVST